MSRRSNLLTARTVAALTSPGRFGDGAGLYLDVKGRKGETGGTRSWVFVYRSPVHRIRRPMSDGTVHDVGRTREMGLGPCGTEAGRVTLAMARERPADARRLLADNLDPLDERNRAPVAARVIPTFGQVADAHIAAMAQGWRNPKHTAQWQSTLADHAASLRAKPVDQITTADVLAVLQPIWQAIPETAARTRGRIEAVLDAAMAQGHRTGEYPAAWRGHLKHILPARSRLTRGHHSALPWQDVPAFIADLRKREGVAALALEFAILTACRSGEVRGACWSEIDTETAVWTIPAARMKAAKEHRIPLTGRA